MCAVQIEGDQKNVIRIVSKLHTDSQLIYYLRKSKLKDEETSELKS